jgi:drug/metabolite transporter (DMT)-like permease
MEQPWIHKAKTDSLFILSPSFLVVAVVFLFQSQLRQIEDKYSFYTWLFLIVFIDVAHVYATLFKTYFVATEFQKRKKLLIGLPILCFLIGMFLFSFGSGVFWSVLAYIAVFHFIRQQYGFMRLYARNESKKWAWIDNLIIYTATIYPMLYWFLSAPRKFNWFVENEFLHFKNPFLITI